MPKFLFEGDFCDLSNDARVLYALLRDRHDLSLANKWFNDSNEVYIIFTRTEMETLLGRSERTVKKAVEQLKAAGLMEEQTQGLNRPNIIYLMAVNLENSGPVNSTGPDPQNLRVQSLKIYGSGPVESTVLDPQILRANQTNINQTDLTHTKINQSIIESDSMDSIDVLNNKDEISDVREVIKDNISFDILKQRFPKEDLVDTFYELICEVMATTRKTIRIGMEEMSTEVVKSVYMKLTNMHIEYVMNCFKQTTRKISNVKAYLITALYNAPTTIQPFYFNQVNSDLYG
jgi:hypothetical protein